MKFVLKVNALGQRGISTLADVGVAFGQSMKGHNCEDGLKVGDQEWLRNEHGAIVGLWKVESE